MYLLLQLKLFSLLFVTILCDTTYNECKKIDEKDSLQYSYSMIVSIRYNCQRKDDLITHCCSGTILSESYILTAADCVHNLPNDIAIAAGIYNRSESEQIIRKVDQIIIHPNWTNDRNAIQYNIALLYLSNPLDFTVNKHITRLCNPTDLNLSEDDVLKYPSNNTGLWIIEWNFTGKDVDDMISAANLQQIKLSAVDNKDPICKGLVYDAEKQFCVRFDRTNKNSCNYEFGEPILRWIENRWIQVGIINFVVEDPSGSCLRMYTRLAYHHKWIESILNSESHTSFTVETTSNLIENLGITYECNAYDVSCGCSMENVVLSSTRIVGGEEAVPYSWSMDVSIRLNDSIIHSCGGSVLTESYILTSAHCVDGAPPTEISIVAGIHDRNKDFLRYHYVHNVYIHPQWNESDDTYQNDIALLYIFPPLRVDGNEKISRTCVPHKSSWNEIINTPSNGSHLAIIGWGSTHSDNNSVPDTLQQASVYTIDNNDSICSQLIYDVEKQFCAGMQNGGLCQGDSGNPIFQWKGFYWEQVGITSYGGRCDRIGFPNIFTRLAYYFDWMESIINKSLTTTTSTPKPTVIPTLYVCNRTSSCGCGKADVALVSSRIVGGENAIESSWPMIVSLRLNGSNSHSCGGTILSNSYILTAAHCLRQISIRNFTGITIAAGMTNRSDPLQIIRTVDRIYMHPNYTSMPGDFRHDIALLHIDQPFIFESNSSLTKTCIHRIDPPLLTNQYPKTGTRLSVIGWGTLRSGDASLPDILQQVQVLTIDNQDSICVTSINNTELQFCAGLAEGGKDSCQGDSGGPIFQWTGQYWEQVGIVSYGRGCAQAGFPGIYTRLSYYYHWIEEILKCNGEHLEPNIQSYVTTTEFSITSPSEMNPNTTSSYWSFSMTSNTTSWSSSTMSAITSWLYSTVSNTTDWSSSTMSAITSWLYSTVSNTTDWSSSRISATTSWPYSTVSNITDWSSSTTPNCTFKNESNILIFVFFLLFYQIYNVCFI